MVFQKMGALQAPPLAIQYTFRYRISLIEARLQGERLSPMSPTSAVAAQ